MNAKEYALALYPKPNDVNAGISLLGFFFFGHWIRSLQESSSESKLQASTPPCFTLDISCLPNVTIWNWTIAVWPWTTAVT